MLAEAFDPPHWAAVAAYFGAAVLLVAAVWTKVIGPWIVKPIANSLHDQMVELIDLQTAQIRMRQDHIESLLADIQKEVSYNGGTSMKDVVRATSQKLDKLIALMEET